MASSAGNADTFGHQLVQNFLAWSSPEGEFRFPNSAAVLFLLLNGSNLPKQILAQAPIPVHPAPADSLLNLTIRAVITAVKSQIDFRIPVRLALVLTVWADDFDPAAQLIAHHEALMQCMVDLLHQDTQNIHLKGAAALLVASCTAVVGPTSVTSAVKTEKLLEMLEVVRSSEEFRTAEASKVRSLLLQPTPAHRAHSPPSSLKNCQM